MPKKTKYHKYSESFKDTICAEKGCREKSIPNAIFCKKHYKIRKKENERKFDLSKVAQGRYLK